MEQMGSVGNYTIEARSLPILGGIASHNFWILRDENNNAVAELHGLATDRETGKALPIGTDEEKHSLRGYHFIHDVDYANSRNELSTMSSYIDAKQPSRVVFSGSKEEAFDRWEAAVAAVNTLNALDLNYPSLGFSILKDTINSNSVFRTFGEIMGLPVQDFPGTLEPGIDHRFISEDEIEKHRNKNYPILRAPAELEVRPFDIINKEAVVNQLGDKTILSINGKDFDLSRFNQFSENILKAEVYYRSDDKKLLAKHDLNTDKLHVFEKNAYRSEEVLVVNNVSEQKLVSLLGQDIEKNSPTLAQHKGMGREA